MLNSALVSGTGRRAALPLHPACGKTGTTQEFRDAWFVGYTAHYIGGVWVGNDDRRSMNRVMGGNLPAKLWHDVMVLAHEGRTPSALPGTIPTAPLAQTAPGKSVPERSGDRPLTPIERIEPKFVERALGNDDTAGTAGSRELDTQPTRATWVSRTVEKVRRWVSGVLG
jgi:penicillin-binding protein 1A